MSTTVQNVYDVFCWRVGETGGLQLGIITKDQFLKYTADAINDFCRDTGLGKIFITQPISFGIPLYLTPSFLLAIQALFVSARFKPRTNLESLDNSRFRWRTTLGVVDVWHEDGLASNSVEVVYKPNWSGVQYPAQASGDHGYQYIDGSQIGTYAGTLDTDGTNLVTWASGNKFKADDTTWFGKSIYIVGVPFSITGIVDDEHLTIDTAIAALSGLAYSVNYPISLPASDRNLTTYGSRMPATSVYAPGDTIPLLPDSACLYLTYGILARVFSSDTELKDLQKAKFCEARWQEGVSIFQTILKEELLDYDDE